MIRYDICYDMIYVMIWYMLWYDIFVNYNWIETRWQSYNTHIHTNNTENDTKQTIHRTTQKYIEQHKNLEECGPCPVFAGLFHLTGHNNWLQLQSNELNPLIRGNNLKILINFRITCLQYVGKISLKFNYTDFKTGKI